MPAAKAATRLCAHEVTRMAEPYAPSLTGCSASPAPCSQTKPPTTRGTTLLVLPMDIRPIRSEADHEAAIERIDALCDAQPGSAEHDKIEVLSVLVSAYEDARWPLLPPTPIEAIKFHMQQNDLKQKDLASCCRWERKPRIGDSERPPSADGRDDQGDPPCMVGPAGIAHRCGKQGCLTWRGLIGAMAITCQTAGAAVIRPRRPTRGR